MVTSEHLRDAGCNIFNTTSAFVLVRMFEERFNDEIYVIHFRFWKNQHETKNYSDMLNITANQIICVERNQPEDVISLIVTST